MKYEFGSAAWMSALHGVVAGAAAAAARRSPGLRYSMCEVYLDCPVRLSGPDGRIAWHYRIDGVNVDFGRTEPDNVDFKVVCDYQGILPAGRFDTRGEPERSAEMARMTDVLIKDGRLRLFGDPSRRPAELRFTHDAIARLTR